MMINRRFVNLIAEPNMALKPTRFRYAPAVGLSAMLGVVNSTVKMKSFDVTGLDLCSIYHEEGKKCSYVNIIHILYG